MAEKNKLVATKKAVSTVLYTLSPLDRFAVVAFGNQSVALGSKLLVCDYHLIITLN